MRAILIASAKAGEAISYSEVLALLGHDFTRPKMRALCKVLSFVDDEAEERGEPELAVLVVRQSDGLPGQGWWVGGAKKHGYTGLWEGPKAAKLIRKVQRQAFEYWAGREAVAFANRPAVSEARTFTVSEDDDGIRLDRWFKRHMPEVSFNLVSRWARTGQLRLAGKRAAPGDRVEAGQEIRIPPAEAAPARPARPQPKREQLTEDEVQLVRDMVIYEDPNAFVLNKPPGLATQGGTKTTQHLDRLLDGLAGDGGRPKLVHRLDKDTSGALLVARSARAAGHFAKAFSGRTARKVYWALVVGVPDRRRGR